MNYIDEKITIWRRHYFKNTTDMIKIMSILRETQNLDNVLNENMGFKEAELLFDFEKPLSVEDNQGSPTIEIFTSKKDSIYPIKIWDNSTL